MRSKNLLAVIFFMLMGRAVFAATPVITSFSPSSGQVGTLVTIIGTNLGTPTAFSIGGKAAVVVSNTGTQLVGFVMPGAATGVISITAGGGTATSAGTFTVLGPTFPTTQQGTALIGTQSTYYSEQGSAVALSADGNTALVGAANNGNGAGACYVFTRTAGTWTEQAQILGTGEAINYAMLGNAVALSADGNTAMVGGSLDGTVADGTSGSIWFFTRTGTTWTQQGTKLQGTGAVAGAVVSQGTSVSLSADGNTAIEGGPNDNTGIGAAWIFTRSNGVWTQLGSKLVGSGGGTGQGDGVALSADGNTAIVGAGSGAGGGYIYTRNGTTWTQQGGELLAAGSANLGGAVAMSADGNTVLLGAPGSNGAWAFGRTGTTWAQLGAEFTFPGGSVYTGAEEGCSVGLSADGYTAIIGAYGNLTDEGGTWVYTRSGSTFTNQGGMLLGTGSSFTSAGYQGQSVALSATGITGIVGAPQNNTETGLAFILNGIPPSIATTAATNLALTMATINGYITTVGLSATVNFQWGTDPNLVGATTTTTFSQGTSPVAANSTNVDFSSNLTGLTQGTTYYYRFNGTNVNGSSSGAILSFTTTSPPPPMSHITFNSPIYLYYGETITPEISSTDPTTPFNYISDNPAVLTITAAGKFLGTSVGNTFISAYQYAPGTTTIEGASLATVYVIQAYLTITANNQTIVWGQPAPVFTETYNGLVNGDTPASLPASAIPVPATNYTVGSAAGTYNITNYPTAYGTAPNYNVSYNNGTLTVTPLYQQPTVTTSPATAITTTGGTINGLVNPNGAPTTVTMQYSTSYDTNLNNPITATLTTGPATLPGSDGSTNYAAVLTGLLPNTTYYYTITGANPEFSGTGTVLSFTTASPGINFPPLAPVIYGSAVVTPGATSLNTTIPITYASGNTNVATITADGTIQPINVGTATITASQTGSGLNPVTQTFTVTPAPLTVTASNQTSVYGANTAALTVTYSGFVNGDTPASLATPPTLVTAASYSASVGPYPIIASAAVDPNYNINYSAGTYTITPAPLTITANNQTVVAGAAIPQLTVTYNGFVNEDDQGDLDAQPSVTTSATSGSSTGQYPITVSGAVDPNYNITYVAGTLTITQALAFNQIPPKTYGDPDFNPGATGTNVTYSSGNTSVVTITDGGNIHIVGAGSVVITASGSGTTVQQTLTINPAPLVITASNQTSVYGANTGALTVTYIGFVDGDTPASLTTLPTLVTAASSSASVGPYPIIASAAVNPNYNITYAAGNYTITPAPLTITANNQTAVSGSAIPQLTVTYNGFVNEDDQGDLATQPLVTTTATSTSGAGTYPITVSGAADANYNISYVAGTLTLTPALAFNQIPPKTYGSPDFNAGATGTDVTYSSANTSVATISESGEIHIVAAGSVVITASAGGASIQQTLIINPAPLTVIANNQTSVYGSNIGELAVTYIGFVNGDTPASLTTQATVSTIANSSSPVGAYPTVASGVSDPNYTITYTAGNYTITPAPLTITANNQTIAFNAAIPPLTVAYNGFVNEDSPDNLTTQPLVATTATATSMAGTYPITVSGAADANYNITYVAGTLTINPLLVFGPLPVKTYGDPDFNPGATGPDVTYTSASTGVASIDDGGDIHIVGAGTSVITASSGGASAQQTLTVNKAPLTVSADNQTSVYGSAIPALTVSYATFVNGDTESSLTTPATAATVATATSNVGTYPITASGAVSSNYSFTYVPGTLTITKATQTITFAPIPTQIVSAPYDSVYNPISNYTKVADPASSAYDLSGVTASSGLPVSFSISDPSLASIRGNSLVSLALGTVTITATQDGNENYLAAAPVSQTFNIEYADGGDVIVSMVVSPNGDGINDILKIINIEQYPDNNMILINRNGVKIFEISGYNNTTRVFDGHSSITGELQQQGTYLYMLRYHDADGVVKVKKGFTELRY